MKHDMLLPSAALKQKSVEFLLFWSQFSSSVSVLKVGYILYIPLKDGLLSWSLDQELQQVHYETQPAHLQLAAGTLQWKPSLMPILTMSCL